MPIPTLDTGWTSYPTTITRASLLALISSSSLPSLPKQQTFTSPPHSQLNVLTSSLKSLVNLPILGKVLLLIASIMEAFNIDSYLPQFKNAGHWINVIGGVAGQIMRV